MKRFTLSIITLLNALVVYAQTPTTQWTIIKPEYKKETPAELHRLRRANRHYKLTPEMEYVSYYLETDHLNRLNIPISKFDIVETRRIHDINEILSYTYSLYTLGGEIYDNVVMDFLPGKDKVLMRLTWDGDTDQAELYSITCYSDKICIDGFYEGSQAHAQNAPDKEWTKMESQTLYYISGDMEGFCYAPEDVATSSYLFVKDSKYKKKAFRASNPLKSTLDSLQNAIKMEDKALEEAKKKARKEAKKHPSNVVVVEEVDENIIYDVVETHPVFPGGDEAFKKWLKEHTDYSGNSAKCRVYTQFVIGKDGSVTDVKIIKSPDQKLAQAAKCILLSMPKWNPGKQRGKTIRTKMQLPIVLNPNKSYPSSPR